MQYAGAAPLNDKGRHLAAMNRELQRGTPLRRMIAAANRDREVVQVAEVDTPQPVVVAEAPSRPLARQFTAPSAASYFVQVGSFADPGNAERGPGRR